MTAHHRGAADPAAVKGAQEEIDRAFRDAFGVLDRRISRFPALPISSLDQMAIKRSIDEIGHR